MDGTGNLMQQKTCIFFSIPPVTCFLTFSSGPGRQHHRCDGAIRSVTQLKGLKQEFLPSHWLSSRICFKQTLYDAWVNGARQGHSSKNITFRCPWHLPFKHACRAVAAWNSQHLVATVSFTGTLGRLCYYPTQLGYCEYPSFAHVLDF